jgi:flagellar hook-length control protein FliK
LHPRRSATPSSPRPGSAAEAQSSVGGHAARQSVASFATAFASALQDDAKEATLQSGDKPAVAIVQSEEALNQPIDALALAQSGKRTGNFTLIPCAKPATPDAPTAAVSTLLRQTRPARPKTLPLPASFETFDSPALGTLEALVASSPLPPHHLTKQASPDVITAPSSNESMGLGVKAGLALADSAIAPSATGVSEAKPCEQQSRPFMTDQPIATPGITSIETTPLTDALNVQPIPNVGVGAPVTAARPQAPERIINAGTPADQVAPAVIRLSNVDGARHISLQLTPTDLGLVEIRIDQPKDGPATITLTVQHPRTLDLLQRDLEQLSQTLDRAGLSNQGRQVSLHLVSTHVPIAPADPVSPPSQQAAAGVQDQSFGQGSGPYANPKPDMGQQSRSRGTPDFTVDGPQPDVAVQASAFTTYQANYRAGLNITA